MNDTAAAQPEAAADGVTAGALLRRAREASGIHVASLAASLKVPVRKLEALEEDRYDQLADTVFVRALASSVCRHLKVDPRPVLDRLPHGSRPTLVPGEGINAPFRAPGDGPAPSWADQLTRPIGLAVVGLLLGALVIILLPGVQRGEGAAPRFAAKTEASPPAPVPAPVTLAPPVGDPAAPAGSAAATTAQAPAASAPQAAADPAPVASAPVAAASVAAAAAVLPAPEAAAQSPGIVEFRAKARSWVQVTDARGKPVFRKMMEGGEIASATGTLPLAVTVGSAQTTEVQVRGKPFDLTPVTRDNVARFEVK